MGAIGTTANSVYRDYIIPGNPASGANKPDKAEIRALFALIDKAADANGRRVSLSAYLPAVPAGTDMRTAFNSAIAYLDALGGGVIYCPPMTLTDVDVSVPVVVPSNIVIWSEPGAFVIEPDLATVALNLAYPLASACIFATGDPATGYRAGRPTSEVSASLGIMDESTLVQNVHVFGISVVSDFNHVALAANHWLHAIYFNGVHYGSIQETKMIGLPSCGIIIQSCRDFRISRNVANYNGFVAVGGALNGISSTGFFDTATPGNTSAGIVITENISNTNRDEGIQNAYTLGAIITNNVLLGNQDKGIEGDSGYSTTATDATYGLQVPGDCIVSGNYINGTLFPDAPNPRGKSATLQGIGWASANDGRIRIFSNTVMNIADDGGIITSQNSKGRIEIFDNYLEAVVPDSSGNSHQIYARGQYVKVFNNTIIAPGTHGSTVTVQGDLKTIAVKGNHSDGGNDSMVNIALSSSGPYDIDSIIVSGNSTLGQKGPGIQISINDNDLDLGVFHIIGNTLDGLISDASLASSRGFVFISIEYMYTADVSDFFVTGNHASYVNAPLYPIMLGGDGTLDGVRAIVMGNDLVGSGAVPTFDYGTRVFISPGLFDHFEEHDNGIPGQAVTYGSAAPVSGAWTQGDKVWNNAPAAAGNIGWVCTGSGTPGTWKTFGAIAA